MPRSPGSGPAFLPRRPCQPLCLWEHLVPELTGTNKKALFLTVWSAFVGTRDGGDCLAEQRGHRGCVGDRSGGYNTLGLLLRKLVDMQTGSLLRGCTGTWHCPAGWTHGSPVAFLGWQWGQQQQSRDRLSAWMGEGTLSPTRLHGAEAWP